MDIQISVHPHKGILLSCKSNELLVPAAVWMNLKGIVLAEIKQKQRPDTVYDSIYTTV